MPRLANLDSSVVVTNPLIVLITAETYLRSLGVAVCLVLDFQHCITSIPVEFHFERDHLEIEILLEGSNPIPCLLSGIYMICTSISAGRKIEKGDMQGYRDSKLDLLLALTEILLGRKLSCR